jgi:hypothetical protein
MHTIVINIEAVPRKPIGGNKNESETKAPYNAKERNFKNRLMTASGRMDIEEQRGRECSKANEKEQMDNDEIQVEVSQRAIQRMYSTVVIIPASM